MQYITPLMENLNSLLYGGGGNNCGLGTGDYNNCYDGTGNAGCSWVGGSGNNCTIDGKGSSDPNNCTLSGGA
jgi:hypothetical protein